MASISLHNICKVYPNGFEAVKDFNLDVADKEFIIFVGPSGCGKSTTLRMIAGLEDITSGELLIDGKVMNSVEPKDRDIAMVFQNYALYPHMTVFDNMAFGLKIRKVDKAEIQKRVMEAAKIDGANKIQTLFRVTIPLMMPQFTICLFLAISNSFKLFDQNLALTNGLPYDGTIGTTQMLALNIYSSFYENLTSLGVGQAKAVVFFLIVAGIALLQLKLTRSKEVEQ